MAGDLRRRTTIALHLALLDTDDAHLCSAARTSRPCIAMNDTCPASHRISPASTVFFQLTYDAAIVLLYHVCLVYCCALCNSIYREFYSESVCPPSNSDGYIGSLGIRVGRGPLRPMRPGYLVHDAMVQSYAAGMP